MNRLKLIKIHTIKGLREETWRPSVLCSEILFVALCLVLFAGAPVVNAKIVFCIEDDIYVMNDNGSALRRLTNNTLSKDRDPRWSPDGKRIAFTRFMDKAHIQTSSELFIMNADGTDQKQLTHNNIADGYPSWSPDGQYLAFRSRHNRKFEVYIMELASQSVQRLTGAEDERELGSTSPDWAPSGREIAYGKFLSNGPGLAHQNIYLMSVNGDNQRPLLPDPPIGAKTILMHFLPHWSSDGEHILFDDCKFRGEGHKCRLTVQRIGGRPQEITDIYERLGDNLLTSVGGWMEHDRAIIFGLKLMDKPNANYDLYRYVFETRRLRRLTRDARDERSPDWIEGSLSVSPQGKLPTRWGDIKHALTRGDMP